MLTGSEPQDSRFLCASLLNCLKDWFNFIGTHSYRETCALIDSQGCCSGQGPGKGLESGPPSCAPLWVAKAILGPSSAAFPSSLPGSWVRSRAAGTGYSHWYSNWVLVTDAGTADNSLPCCVTLPVCKFAFLFNSLWSQLWEICCAFHLVFVKIHDKNNSHVLVCFHI